MNKINRWLFGTESNSVTAQKVGKHGRYSAHLTRSLQ
jgi:hypothetical protein